MKPDKQKMTKVNLFLFSFLLFTFISVNNSVAQTTWYTYYVSFTENGPFRDVYQPGVINYEIKVINPNPVSVNVSIGGIGGGSNTTATINAGSTHIFMFTSAQVTAAFEQLPATALGPGYGNQTSSKSVTVSSNNYPVLVCAMTQAPLTADVTNMMSDKDLGTEYYCINYIAAQTAVEFGSLPYTPKSGFMIIATNPGSTDVFENGTKKATLNSGNVYYSYAYYGDMTGTHITTTQPVACIAMSTVATVPTGSIHADVLFQQLPPVNQWGRKFAVPLILSQNRIRVVATKNGTNIEVNGATLSWAAGAKNYLTGLNAGEFVELSLSDINGCYIEANKPVGVCSFLTGDQLNGGGSTSGDPAQAWAPPIEQMAHDIPVSAFHPNKTTYLNPNEHYALVITPTATRSQTTGHSGLNTAIWREITGSNYSYCILNLASHVTNPVTYIIDNPGGVIVGGYGLGQTESYYYYSGFDTKDLTTGFTVNGEDYIDMDGKHYCDNNFTFEAYPDTLSSIVWTMNDVEIPGSANQLIVTVNNLADGYYTINMFTHNMDHITHFYVGRSNVIWTPENNSGVDKRNWNNSGNWTPALIPTNCNNVFIPGNLENYPDLSSRVECNDIYFMQGAELGRPDLLTYKKAFVQLNFDLKQNTQQRDGNQNLILQSVSTLDRMKYSAAVSADPLSREQWYLLSSPLRGVVTGDLSFGGFPLTFLMKFGPVDKDNVHYQVGKWTTPYTELDETVSPAITDGFAFYMYGYGDYPNKPDNNDGCEETGFYTTLNDMEYLPTTRSDLKYGIEETNGILELPFFADSTGLYAHRTQVYNSAPTPETSTFYYISDGTANPSDFNTLTGISASVNREANDGNYRFIPEIHNGSEWVFPPTINHSGEGIGSDDEFLVGNPLMSSIDMGKFITENSATILPQFRIWNGSGYIDYTVSGGVVGSPVPGDINPGYIAPLQAFILRTDGDPAGGTVAAFNVNTISTVRPSGLSNLRSNAEEENTLRIRAENDFAASYMLIGYKENAVDGFRRGEDVQKLFSFLDYVPEIYALADEIPASIRFINNKKEIIIPFGVKTGRTGEIRLTFTGMDNYLKAKKIELTDALENKTIDLTGKSNFTYTFNNSETGIRNGRFSLRIKNSITALPDVIDSDNLKIYGDSKGIYVITSSSDPVKQITVHDFQGRKIYESASNANFYPIERDNNNSPLIVKVITNNQVKTEKIIINH